MEKWKPKTVDEYIGQLPEIGKSKILELRSILKGVAPQAKEGLKWGKPMFESEVILFVYAAHKGHLSFVPTAPALEPFEKELSGYTTKKDSVQFPYDKTLPSVLIEKIAQFRKEDVEQRGAKWKY